MSTPISEMTGGTSARINKIFSLFSWLPNKYHARIFFFSPPTAPTEEEHSWKLPGGFVCHVWDLNFSHALQLPGTHASLPFASSPGHVYSRALKLSLVLTWFQTTEAQRPAGCNLNLSNLDFFKLQGWYILQTSFIRGDAAYELWTSIVLGKIDLHTDR